MITLFYKYYLNILIVIFLVINNILSITKLIIILTEVLLRVQNKDKAN